MHFLAIHQVRTAKWLQKSLVYPSSDIEPADREPHYATLMGFNAKEKRKKADRGAGERMLGICSCRAAPTLPQFRSSPYEDIKQIYGHRNQLYTPRTAFFSGRSLGGHDPRLSRLYPALRVPPAAQSFSTDLIVRGGVKI